MGSYLKDFSDVKPKNSFEEALQRWWKTCWPVKNRKRRFRFTSNLSKHFEVREIQKSNKEKLKVALLVLFRGICYSVPKDVKGAGFEIDADELGSTVEGHNVRKLKVHGGVEGLVGKLSTSVSNGINNSEETLSRRRKVYGINKFVESPANGFWLFVWEALQDTTLMILAVSAVVSLIVGIATEGWPKGAHDGLGIVASIHLVVFVLLQIEWESILNRVQALEKLKQQLAEAEAEHEA